jgi:NTP pyrophosphatase (non-canonical NTP hydrolase)
LNATTLSDFQNQVSELLLRHRSLLDVLSKHAEANSAVHRAVAKAVTECGCIEVHAQKQKYAQHMTREDAKNMLQTHVFGELCDHCLEVIGDELGKNLFYMTALCNLLHIRLDDVIEREAKKISTLGFFNMS